MLFSYTRSDRIDISGFPSHMHNEYEILYFLEGDADYMIEGSVYKLSKHDVLLIRPRTFHNLLPRSDAVYERFVINFSPDEIPDTPAGSLAGIPALCSAANDPLVCGFFEEWKKYSDKMDEKELFSFLTPCVGPVITALSYLKKRDAATDEKTDIRLKQVLDHIDADPCAPFTVDSLAERFYMSPSWLSHMFSAKMGVGIMQYACRKRMLYAQKLITEGVPPTEAAEMCGIDNYSTFYRQYKKTIGTAPKNDRKNV